MGGLLHLEQQGGAWADCGLSQFPPCSTGFLIHEPFTQLPSSHTECFSFESSSVTLKLPQSKISVFHIYHPPSSSTFCQPKFRWIFCHVTHGHWSLKVIGMLCYVIAYIGSVLKRDWTVRAFCTNRSDQFAAIASSNLEKPVTWRSTPAS